MTTRGQMPPKSETRELVESDRAKRRINEPSDWAENKSMSNMTFIIALVLIAAGITLGLVLLR